MAAPASGEALAAVGGALSSLGAALPRVCVPRAAVEALGRAGVDGAPGLDAPLAVCAPTAVVAAALGVLLVCMCASLAACLAHRALPRSFGGGSGRGDGARTLLLVIAHPDDESMFFVPALRAFAAAGWRVAILCCTDGHGGGDAGVRSRELLAAGSVLGVARDDITVLSLAALPDSMTGAWDPLVVRGVVATEAVKRRADAVLTFDARGVSGHINHRGAHAGVALYAAQSTAVPCYALDTVPLWRKFSAVADVSVSAAVHAARQCCTPSRAWPRRLLLTALSPATTFAAMSAHASQYVWFRRLFVLFSRYTWVNSLTAIPAGDAVPGDELASAAAAAPSPTLDAAARRGSGGRRRQASGH